MEFSEQAYYTFGTDPSQLSADFGNMSVAGPEADYDDDIMESVSQVAANRPVYAEPDYSGLQQQQRSYREGRTGSGHSSGGSGYGSDRQKKSAMASASENSQAAHLFNPPLPVLLNVPALTESGFSHQAYRNVVKKTFEPYSAHL